MKVIIDYETCESCEGQGKMRSAFHDLPDIEQMKAADQAHYTGEELVEADDIICPFCKGEGKLPVIECSRCNGTGLEESLDNHHGGVEFEDCAKCNGDGYYVDRGD